MTHGYLPDPRAAETLKSPSLLDGFLVLTLEICFLVILSLAVVALYHCASEDVAILEAINQQFDIYDENAVEKRG